MKPNPTHRRGKRKAPKRPRERDPIVMRTTIITCFSFPGVLGAAREEGGVRNTRGRSAQRESEGPTVPFKLSSKQVSARGLAEAPKDPLKRELTEKGRKLQRRLWVAAKRQPGRRFHALYAQVHRSDVLCEAWKRVKANRGAAGVDEETLGQVEAYGVERMLSEVQSRCPGGNRVSTSSGVTCGRG